MIDLERKLGPMRLRAWGLVVNLAANVVLLYGIARVIDGRGGWIWLGAGAAVTVLCILTLARPVSDDHPSRAE